MVAAVSTGRWSVNETAFFAARCPQLSGVGARTQVPPVGLFPRTPTRIGRQRPCPRSRRSRRARCSSSDCDRSCTAARIPADTAPPASACSNSAHRIGPWSSPQMSPRGTRCCRSRSNRRADPSRIARRLLARAVATVGRAAFAAPTADAAVERIVLQIHAAGATAFRPVVHATARAHSASAVVLFRPRPSYQRCPLRRCRRFRILRAGAPAGSAAATENDGEQDHGARRDPGRAYGPRDNRTTAGRVHVRPRSSIPLTTACRTRRSLPCRTSRTCCRSSRFDTAEAWRRGNRCSRCTSWCRPRTRCRGSCS